MVVVRSEWLNEVMTGKLRPCEVGKWEVWYDTCHFWECTGPDKSRQETQEDPTMPADLGNTDIEIESNLPQKQTAVDPRLTNSSSAESSASMISDPIDNQLGASTSVRADIEDDDGWPSDATNQDDPVVHSPLTPPVDDTTNNNNNQSLLPSPNEVQTGDQNDGAHDQDDGWSTGLPLSKEVNERETPHTKVQSALSSPWCEFPKRPLATAWVAPSNEYESNHGVPDDEWPSGPSAREVYVPLPQCSNPPARKTDLDDPVSPPSPFSSPGIERQSEASGWLNQDDGWATESTSEVDVRPWQPAEFVPSPSGLLSPLPVDPTSSQCPSTSAIRLGSSQAIAWEPSPIASHTQTQTQNEARHAPVATSPADPIGQVAVDHSIPVPTSTCKAITFKRPTAPTSSISSPMINSGHSTGSSPLSSLDDLGQGEITRPITPALSEVEWLDEIVCIPLPVPKRSRSRPSSKSTLTSSGSGTGLDTSPQTQSEIETPQRMMDRLEATPKTIMTSGFSSRVNLRQKHILFPVLGTPASKTTSTSSGSGSGLNPLPQSHAKIETPQRMMDRLEAAPKTIMTSGFSPRVNLRIKRILFSGSETKSQGHLPAPGSSSSDPLSTAPSQIRQKQGAHARKRSRVSYTPTLSLKIPGLDESESLNLSSELSPPQAPAGISSDALASRSEVASDDIRCKGHSERDDHRLTPAPPSTPTPTCTPTFAPSSASAPMYVDDVERLLMEVEEEAGSRDSSPLTPSPEDPESQSRSHSHSHSRSRQTVSSTPSWSSSLESLSTGPSPPSTPTVGQAHSQELAQVVSTNLLVQLDRQDINHKSLVSAPAPALATDIASSSLRPKAQRFHFSAEVLASLESLGTQLGMELLSQDHHPSIHRKQFMDDDIMSLINHRTHQVRFYDIIDEDKDEDGGLDGKAETELELEVENAGECGLEGAERDNQAESFRRALEGMIGNIK